MYTQSKEYAKQKTTGMQVNTQAKKTRHQSTQRQKIHQDISKHMQKNT